MEHHQDVRIITVPYDSGHSGLRMGAGPEHLLDNGLGEAVRPEGRRPSVTNVRHEIEPTAEVATAFELHALVSGQVRHTIAEGGFPLVLSGNCNTAAIGAIAGAGPEGLGIVWYLHRLINATTARIVPTERACRWSSSLSGRECTRRGRLAVGG